MNLGERLFRFSGLLVIDAEVEPRVGQQRIEPLDRP
jgi:hypothetical protein